MIANTVDHRQRPHRWKTVNAIIEATWHDNSAKDADQAEKVGDPIELTYAEREGVSVEQAIAWAQEASGPCPVTLYLYDEGEGTTVAAMSIDGEMIYLDERRRPKDS